MALPTGTASCSGVGAGHVEVASQHVIHRDVLENVAGEVGDVQLVVVDLTNHDFRGAHLLEEDGAGAAIAGWEGHGDHVAETSAALGCHCWHGIGWAHRLCSWCGIHGLGVHGAHWRLSHVASAAGWPTVIAVAQVAALVSPTDTRDKIALGRLVVLA